MNPLEKAQSLQMKSILLKEFYKATTGWDELYIELLKLDKDVYSVNLICHDPGLDSRWDYMEFYFDSLEKAEEVYKAFVEDESDMDYLEFC